MDKARIIQVDRRASSEKYFAFPAYVLDSVLNVSSEPTFHQTTGILVSKFGHAALGTFFCVDAADVRQTPNVHITYGQVGNIHLFCVSVRCVEIVLAASPPPPLPPANACSYHRIRTKYVWVRQRQKNEFTRRRHTSPPSTRPSVRPFTRRPTILFYFVPFLVT